MPSRRRSPRARASSISCAAAKPTNTNGAPSTAGTAAAPSAVLPPSDRLPDGEAPWLAAVPARFRDALERAARGALPANVALMHVLMAASDEAEARAVLDSAVLVAPSEPASVLAGIVGLLEAHPAALRTVKTILARLD